MIILSVREPFLTARPDRLLRPLKKVTIMKRKPTAASMILRLEKGQKHLPVSREFLDMIGLTDGSLALVEVVGGEIRIKPPVLNYGKFVGLLSGKGSS